MSFGAPFWLWIIPGVFVLTLLDFYLRSRRRKKLETFIPAALRERMGLPQMKGIHQVRGILVSFGLLLIAFSISRPQWGFSWRDAQREGLDLMVVLDTSNSMRADDFKPSRLQRAKWGIEELVGEMKGDRMGLIAFAGEGVVQCPLTLDYGAFLMNVQDLFPGIVPVGGTNLQAALEKAMESFEESSEADRVILLITDGESHQGDIASTIQQLNEANIRVFAVGVGTPEGSLIPLDPSSNDFLKNRNQEVVKSNLDEKTLKRISSATDGLYVKANPRDFGASELISEGLRPLKRAQLESERVKEMEERYQIFLAAGLILLFMEAMVQVPAKWTEKRGEQT